MVTEDKNCHICNKKLSRKFESLFLHCFECNLQRLEEMTVDFDPCVLCNKRRNTK